MRLIPVKALDQPAETEWIKVADTKNCLTFATGIMRSGTSVSGGSGGPGAGSHCLCVAVKRQVIIYEITRLKSRHKRLREVLLPAQAQSLDVFSEGRLCVGYQSGFTIYRYENFNFTEILFPIFLYFHETNFYYYFSSLLGDQHPLSLVHPDNQMLGKFSISQKKIL